MRAGTTRPGARAYTTTADSDDYGLSPGLAASPAEAPEAAFAAAV